MGTVTAADLAATLSAAIGPDPDDDTWAPFWDLTDRLTDALNATGDLTPSQAARKTGTDTFTARRALIWLADHRYAHTSGNGAWTHYHPGRAR